MTIITGGKKIDTLVWDEVLMRVRTLEEYLDSILTANDENYHIWLQEWCRCSEEGYNYDEIEPEEMLWAYLEELVEEEDRNFLKEHYGVMFKIY